jgi:ubiquinone/menaquinone biosynthesis C-methylase UbiE
MAKARSLWGQLFLSSLAQIEHEEKVLRYIIHRIDEDANLYEVLQEPYVRRNCSQAEIEEIMSSADLVHACREHLERTFRSGELDPRQRSQIGRS